MSAIETAKSEFKLHYKNVTLILALLSFLALISYSPDTENKGDPSTLYPHSIVEFNQSELDEITENDLNKLNDQKIQQHIIGRILFPATGRRTASFKEDFAEAGRWKGVYDTRAPLMLSGKWIIENDQICVAVDNGKALIGRDDGVVCRDVWKHKELEIYKIADFLSTKSLIFVTTDLEQ